MTSWCILPCVCMCHATYLCVCSRSCLDVQAPLRANPEEESNIPEFPGHFVREVVPLWAMDRPRHRVGECAGRNRTRLFLTVTWKVKAGWFKHISIYIHRHPHTSHSDITMVYIIHTTHTSIIHCHHRNYPPHAHCLQLHVYVLIYLWMKSICIYKPTKCTGYHIP